MARSRKSGLCELLFFSLAPLFTFFDVVVVVVSEGRGADDPRRVLSGEIDRNNDIFFLVGDSQKKKEITPTNKEFYARRVCGLIGTGSVWNGKCTSR